jgi:hypothetical protein
MSGTADVPTRVAPAHESEPLSRRRATAVWSLVALATLLLLVSSLTVWVKRQALDTDAWTDVSGRLLENDDIRSALSIYLVNTLYDNVDVTARVEQALPPQRSGLAPVIAGALRQFSERAANQLLATPRVQNLWEEVNRRAHENLIAVLEGKNVRRFTTEEGTVVLDLSPLVDRLGARLGISERLPPDAGKITILESDQLDAAQKTLKVIKALTIFLVLVVLGLYALAIYLAHGHRRRILRAAAVAFIFVGLLLLVVRRLAGDWIVDSLVKADAVRPAGNATWAIATELLRDVGIALLAYGIVGLVGAWLAGPTRLAVGARRRLAPTFREQPAIVFGAVAFVYLLVIVWGPTAATRQLLGIIIFGVLIFLGVEVLRRQTLAEFPPAGLTRPDAPAARGR